jgi:hypothetical protein
VKHRKRRALCLVGAALTLGVGACAKKPPVALVAPSGPWVSLFDGRDLNGWTVKIAGHDVNDNFANTFRVEDGLLKVAYDGYDKFNGQFGSLFYNKRLSHYWFRAEYRFVGKLTPGAPSWAYRNSGVQLQGQPPETMRKAQEFPVSVEFDIVGGRFFGRHPTGDVCENGTRVTIDGRLLEEKCSRLSDVTIPGDEWVTMLAEVDGSTRVRQAVNGMLVVEYTHLTLDDHDADGRRLVPPDGDVRLGSGFLSIQSNGHPIEFRRIEILPLE